MPRRRLRENLEALHAELERTERVDPGARALLADLMRDIQELLERSGGETRDEDRSLVDRLSEATREFEESHPRLAATVGRVVDALANMGI